MSKTDQGRKENGERQSTHLLTPEEAMRRALNTPPPKKPKPADGKVDVRERKQ